MRQAIAVAKELKDWHALAMALSFASLLGHYKRDHAKVEVLASEVIDLSTRNSFAYWLAAGMIFRGWAQSVSGDTAGGLSMIEDGIRTCLSIGSVLNMPFFLTLKAEALHLADRSSKALDALDEAKIFIERYEDRSWLAELSRLRGVFLMRLRADESEIKEAFRIAIRMAKQQKSASLAARAEATFAQFNGN